MNYIDELTADEIRYICERIGGKLFKELYRRNPRLFNAVWKGRADSLEDEQAVSLAVKNYTREWLSSFINKRIKNWLEEIHDRISGYSEGADYVPAAACILSNSQFSDNPELFYKLTTEAADNTEHEAVCDKVKTIVQYRSLMSVRRGEAETDADKSVGTLRGRIEQLETEAAEREHAFETVKSDYEEKLSRAEAERLAAAEQLKTLQDKWALTEAVVQRKEEKLKTYDDSYLIDKLSKEHDYISVCEVDNPDRNANQRAIRLADIAPDGEISAFIPCDDSDKYYGNRKRLFLKDGPSEIGTIGVWDWTPEENKSNPAKDFHLAEYETSIPLTEIVVIQTASCIDDVVQALKAGIEMRLTSERAVFAYRVSDEQFDGILCNKNDLEESEGRVSVKKVTTSLPRYKFCENDTIKLKNNKIYYRNISVGPAYDVVYMKDRLEIVRDKVLKSLSALQKRGNITKSTYRSFRDFIAEIHTGDTVQEIAEEFSCSETDARNMLEQFLTKAHDYIEGKTLEDTVISSVIFHNQELLDICTDKVREQWRAENTDIIEKAGAEQRALEQQIKIGEDRKNEIDNAVDAAEKKLTDIESKITANEQLASEVERLTEERINNARGNIAEFLVSMGFAVPGAVQPQSQPGDIHDVSCYTPGRELQSDDPDVCRNWSDVISTAEYELDSAGAAERYTQGLAAYLSAAYICRYPVLMAGPNAADIANAFSCSLFGREAGILCADGRYSPDCVQSAHNSEDKVIIIRNPFSSEWINRLPDIVSDKERFYIAVHPYTEDVLIEPKSLYNYFMPLFTDAFVSHEAKAGFTGGKTADDFDDYKEVNDDLRKYFKVYRKLVKALRVTPLIEFRMGKMIAAMHALNQKASADDDVMFIFLPYAMAAMQTDRLIDECSGGNFAVSAEVRQYLNDMFGDNDG